MLVRRWTLALVLIQVAIVGLILRTRQTASVHAQGSESGQVPIETDGTVQVPARSVPLSSLLSPQAKKYVTDHLKQMQDPQLLVQDAGVPRFMKPMLARDHELFALDRSEEQIGGVHTYVYQPKAGLSPRNKARVLINLHGGGFTGCWPGCAELESMPIAAIMGIEVVSVDYREGPHSIFPAASEDVASVYRTLLKSYQPQQIGIYGCSAGGLLTAMSLAWFQKHNLPMPGAAGIFCASAGTRGGDALYIAYPLGEGRMPPPGSPALSDAGYFRGADLNDPLVSPIVSPEILARFPPTLIISGTRDFAMSGALFTDNALTRAGVSTELHVWDGLFHGFFYNADIPESQDAFRMIARFFDRHLDAVGTRSHPVSSKFP